MNNIKSIINNIKSLSDDIIKKEENNSSLNELHNNGAKQFIMDYKDSYINIINEDDS